MGSGRGVPKDKNKNKLAKLLKLKRKKTHKKTYRKMWLL